MDDERGNLQGFLDVLGLSEEPMGMYYTNDQPDEGFSPKPNVLPTADQESKGQVDFKSVFGHYSCVLGNIWLARKKKTAAYFDRERYGCLGGAFYLGYLKPQLNVITCYVSTGIPGFVDGERYVESPDMTRRFFEIMDPRPAPARYCVFKPVSRFEAGQTPEVVTFFARPESMSGLHQLAVFVTNDLEAVASPFGAACCNIVTWPVNYLAQGRLRAVLGGWDPSARKYFKTDELSLAMPYPMYQAMLARWRESFLTAKAWGVVRKKIERSRRTWGDE